MPSRPRDAETITIRFATTGDAEAIARQTRRVQQMHNDALPDTFKPPSENLFPPQRLAALLQDPNAVVAVADLGGKVIGHLCAAIMTRAESEFHHAGRYLYIQQIGVDDDSHRLGAGTALVAFVSDWAQALGMVAMQVDHWAFNARAGRFFERCGFAPMKITMRRALNDDGAS